MATPLVALLTKKYGGTGGDEARYRRMRDLQVPTGKMGSGWDIAHAALFLCSDEAGYVTGWHAQCQAGQDGVSQERGQLTEYWGITTGLYVQYSVGDTELRVCHIRVLNTGLAQTEPLQLKDWS